jgi:hypothetical protein
MLARLIPILLTAAYLFIPPAWAGASTAESLSEDDLLIVQLSYASLKLEDSLFVYQTPEHTFVPLQGLIDALDFPLSIDLDALSVEGWFISENKRFSLDIKRESLYIQKQRQSWPKHFRYGVDGFDLYIDLRSLEQWFGFTLNLDVSQLNLALSSQEELPVIKQKLRSAKRAKLAKQGLSPVLGTYIKNDYDWIGPPSLDIELSYDAEKTADHNGTAISRSDKVSHFKSVTIQGAMDTLKHSMQTSYINQDGEQDLRVTLSKAAEGPDKSLFLGIDEYHIGDINSHSDSLLFNSSSGTGIGFKRGANSLSEQSNDLLIEGDAPPGWEVELYRNGALIDFTNPAADGRYRFQNVSTYMGENIFDIRIYGPQGQFRSDQKKITIGGQMLAKGTWEYQTYLQKRNQPLIRSSLNTQAESSEFFVSEASIGVNDYLTLQANLSHFTPQDNSEAHNYLSLGGFASFAGGLANIKLATDDSGDNAFALSYKARLLDINYNIDLTRFNDLISDHNPNGELSQETKFRLNGLWTNLLPQSISYDIDIQHQAYQSKIEQWLISKRLSTRLGQTQVASSFSYTHSNAFDFDDSLLMNLSATRRWYNWRLKSEMNYRILSSGNFESGTLSGSYQASKHINFQTGLTFTNDIKDTYRIDNALSWNFNAASLSISAGFDNQDRQTLGLTLSSSLSYDKPSRSLSLSRTSSASSASLVARTFIDANNNGRFDKQEEALENIRFKGRNSWRDTSSNAQGLVTLGDISNLSMQTISLDPRSIEDPFLKPIQTEFQIFSHAGKRNEIDIAFVPTIEVEGEISLETSALSGVPITLSSINTDKIYTTISEYDGVFIFEGVFPGKYHLTLDEQHIKTLNLAPIDVLNVAAFSKQGVIYLDKISLQHKQNN